MLLFGTSTITIKGDSGVNAKALFGVGASVAGDALRAGATGTLKTALTGGTTGTFTGNSFAAHEWMLPT